MSSRYSDMMPSRGIRSSKTCDTGNYVCHGLSEHRIYPRKGYSHSQQPFQSTTRFGGSSHHFQAIELIYIVAYCNIRSYSHDYIPSGFSIWFQSSFLLEKNNNMPVDISSEDLGYLISFSVQAYVRIQRILYRYRHKYIYIGICISRQICVCVCVV